MNKPNWQLKYISHEGKNILNKGQRRWKKHVLVESNLCRNCDQKRLFKWAMMEESELSRSIVGKEFQAGEIFCMK